MLISALQKNFIIAKKYMVFLLIGSFALPLFTASRLNGTVGSAAGAMGFIVSVIFIEFMIYSSVAIVEMKYNKAQLLMCSLPYSRKTLVQSKYCFNIIVFLVCTLTYVILANVSNARIGNVNTMVISQSFFLVNLFFAIIIPLEYKFGYEKTKYICFLIMYATPFLIGLLSKNISQGNVNLDFIEQMSNTQFMLALYVITFIIIYISYRISVYIFSNKDL